MLVSVCATVIFKLLVTDSPALSTIVTMTPYMPASPKVMALVFAALQLLSTNTAKPPAGHAADRPVIDQVRFALRVAAEDRDGGDRADDAARGVQAGGGRFGHARRRGGRRIAVQGGTAAQRGAKRCGLPNGLIAVSMVRDSSCSLRSKRGDRKLCFGVRARRERRADIV